MSNNLTTTTRCCCKSVYVMHGSNAGTFSSSATLHCSSYLLHIFDNLTITRVLLPGDMAALAPVTPKRLKSYSFPKAYPPALVLIGLPFWALQTASKDILKSRHLTGW